MMLAQALLVALMTHCGSRQKSEALVCTHSCEPPAASDGPSAAATAEAAAAAASLLLPVVFPLAQYERLSGQLLQFGRQHSLCLLAAAGTVPGPTLKAARWVAAAVLCAFGAASIDAGLLACA